MLPFFNLYWLSSIGCRAAGVCPRKDSPECHQLCGLWPLLPRLSLREQAVHTDGSVWALVARPAVSDWGAGCCLIVLCVSCIMCCCMYDCHMCKSLSTALLQKLSHFPLIYPLSPPLFIFFFTGHSPLHGEENSLWRHHQHHCRRSRWNPAPEVCDVLHLF